MKTDEITELTRALEVHQSLLSDYLSRDDIHESFHYLPIAGQLRVLLCDANVPILLRYANERGIDLTIWGPIPLPKSLEQGLVLSLNLMVASWTPFFRSLQMNIEDYLDTSIGYSVSLEASSQAAKSYTPRQVIKWVANNEGIAHLNFKKPQTLLGLKAWKWNSDGETYDDGLIRKIILQIGAWAYPAIGEVLAPVGSISIVIRLRLECLLNTKVPFFYVRHDHNAVEIHCPAIPNGVEVSITKNGGSVGQINNRGHPINGFENQFAGNVTLFRANFIGR